MVGNDVVDLQCRDADPSTLSARFDERVFSETELEWLGRSASAARLRWTLWAAKEAAYKLLVKCDPGLVFSPSNFRVKCTAEGVSGVVETGCYVVPIRVSEGQGAIHVVASTDDASLISAAVRAEPEAAADPSRAVRQLATSRIASELGIDPGALEIRKRGRIPELFIAGERAAGDLSLSHHGDVVGFVFSGLPAAAAAGRSA